MNVGKYFFFSGFCCTSIDRMTRRACYTKRLMDLRVREKLFTSSLSNNNKTSNLFIHDKKFQKSCSVVKSKFKNHLFLTQRILRHHCCTHLDTLKFKIRNISLRWRSKNFIILIDHFTFFPGNCWIDFGDFYENLK